MRRIIYSIFLLSFLIVVCSLNVYAATAESFNDLNQWTVTPGTGSASIVDGRLYVNGSASLESKFYVPDNGDFTVSWDEQIVYSGVANAAYGPIIDCNTNDVIPILQYNHNSGVDQDYVYACIGAENIYEHMADLNNPHHYRMDVYRSNDTVKIWQDGVFGPVKSGTTIGGSTNGKISIYGQGQYTQFYVDNLAISDGVGETDIIEFSLANITVNKNVGFFTIPVIRTGNYSYDASVQYYTQDGTASAGVDYGQLSGTLNFTDGVLTVNTPHVMIYDTEPTITRTFTLQLVNPVNGVLGDNTTLNVTVQATGTYVISVNPNPCALYTNVSATLNINDPNYLYDNIQWFFNGVQFSEYRLNDSSQWQNWNGAAWVNCTNASVFQQSHYVDVVSHQAFTAFINYHDTRMGVAVGNFNSTDNVTQTNYYIRVVDSTGADLSTFNGHFFESEYPVKEYWFNWSGYGAVLDLNRHFQGVISADGYINGTIAFETTYNSSAAATYRTITITMVSSDVPADPLQAFLDVKVYDATTNEMVPDAVFTLTNSSGSKTYQIYGTVKRITIMKDTAYTWKASSSSYYALTGSINMTAGQAMLLVPLNPIPAPTATPQPSTGYYTGGDGQATYTPYTDTQRQNQAMTMIDQLLSAGPSLMQLGILAVFMGLVMMLFPDGKKRRYR